MALSPGTLTVMLDSAWRVTLVLAVAWGATRLLARRPAAVRHAVWAAALLVALAVPMVAGVVPSWRIAVLPAAPMARAVVPSSPNVPPSRPIPPPRAQVVTRASADDDSASAPFSAPAPAPPSDAPPARSTADWLGLLWASVAAAIIGRYFASVASVRWLTRDAEPVTDSRWRDASDVASAELGLPESPALLASDHVTVPFTSGILRPVVVVPASALTTWTDERIRVVLLHELAHVRRRDCLVQAMSQIACAAYWFNPLTWVAARRLRTERERACDDLVLEAGLRGADYAQHLLDIARTVTARRSLSAAALAMARPSELEGRLLAILDGHRVRPNHGLAPVVARGGRRCSHRRAHRERAAGRARDQHRDRRRGHSGGAVGASADAHTYANPDTVVERPAIGGGISGDHRVDAGAHGDRVGAAQCHGEPRRRIGRRAFGHDSQQRPRCRSCWRGARCVGRRGRRCVWRRVAALEHAER